MRRETPAPDITTLVTGHFYETRGYATWRPRGTTDWLLILTLSGSGAFGDELITARGDAVLLRPGTPHAYRVARGEARWELLWTHFHPRAEWLDWLRWPERADGVRHLSLGDAFEKTAARLEDAHRLATTSGLPRRDRFALNALEEALLWCDSVNPGAQTPLDPRVRAVLERLSRNPAETVALGALAETVGLSASRLAHLFRAQTGQTPQQFQEQERMARARQLLELTQRPIGQIALEVGYDNPFYFSLRFRRHAGMSPRDFRRRRDSENQRS